MGVISAIVVGLIIAAIVLLVNESDEIEESRTASALSLEDVLQGRLNPRSFNATWTSGRK